MALIGPYETEAEAIAACSSSSSSSSGPTCDSITTGGEWYCVKCGEYPYTNSIVTAASALEALQTCDPEAEYPDGRVGGPYASEADATAACNCADVFTPTWCVYCPGDPGYYGTAGDLSTALEAYQYVCEDYEAVSIPEGASATFIGYVDNATADYNCPPPMPLFMAATQSTVQPYPQKWYLLNLARRPDRLTEATRQLTAAGIQFERFEGVDGAALPLPATETKGAGAYGCRLSHVGMMQDAIVNKLDCVAVFEDDVVLADPATFQLRLNELLAQLPDDWDMLYLGGQHRKTPTPVRDGIVRCTDCHRTHSYIVRGHAIRRLYQIWSSETGHVDHILNRTGAFRELKAYACDPWLTGQGESKSDINGRVNKERWWGDKKKCGTCNKRKPLPQKRPIR